MIFNNKEFRPYDEDYYASKDGDIYSRFKKDCLKHQIDCDGYHRVDIHGKHKKVHKIVYNAWAGEVEPGKLLRHFDDNKDNNHLDNLVVGTQKQNIEDSFRNGHKHLKGNTYTLVVYDKLINERLIFCPAEKFIAYSGHSCQNGGVSRMMTRDWFKKRFEVIEYRLGKV